MKSQESISYFVHSAEIREDGVLRVSTAGFDGKCLFNGYHDVPPGSVDYKFWLWLKERHKRRWYQVGPVAGLNVQAIKKFREEYDREVPFKQTDYWPFDQPRNCATFTMRQVLDGSEPILLVSHDEEDHSWQFLGASAASMTDAKLVCLEEIVRLDPTVLEVADLLPGWQAVRERVGDPWTRREHPPIPEDER